MRQESAVRMYMVMVLFLFGFLAVVVKLVTIQVRDHDKFEELARIQYESREAIPATRGLILDRNFTILVSNTTEYTVAVDPQVLQDRAGTAAILSRMLNLPLAEVRAKLRTEDRRFVVLARRVPEQVVTPWRPKLEKGVRLLPTPRRRYNFGSFASQVIGYTNVENRGMCGVELQMNGDLAGQDGFIVLQRNARGERRPEVEYPSRDPVNGRSVVLTIDQAYQTIAEEELNRGVEQYGASSGRCVIMNPRTGEILAMVNAPGFDLNDLSNFSADRSRNRLVADLYEPGSTFKLVAMSAALNEGLYGPEDKIFAENGSWQYSPDQKPIPDEHKAGMITMRKAFEYSSNIVSAKIARALGAEKFYKYARNFGFGVKSGLELPGELSGDLRKPIKWDGVTLMYMAFGYGLSVTAMQMACAYAAIANDGVLMRPFIRRWLLDENRTILDETVPQVVRRVVSSSTAATMREFMRGVVDSGTATRARIEGLEIGGKTGTSQRLVNGNYSKSSHVASFVGFFPVDDPKLLILVVLDAPTRAYYGGVTAAPIFRDIALRIVSQSPEFARKPSPLLLAAAENTQVVVPDVRGLRVRNASEVMQAQQLVLQAVDKGEVVCDQEPAPGTTVHRRSIIAVRTMSTVRADAVTMPNLVGMTVRQASNYLHGLKLRAMVQGSGIVRAQSHSPGVSVPRGTLCVLNCDPPRISGTQLY